MTANINVWVVPHEIIFVVVNECLCLMMTNMQAPLPTVMTEEEG
jgi:hypothetical protein